MSQTRPPQADLVCSSFILHPFPPHPLSACSRRGRDRNHIARVAATPTPRPIANHVSAWNRVPPWEGSPAAVESAANSSLDADSMLASSGWNGRGASALGGAWASPIVIGSTALLSTVCSKANGSATGPCPIRCATAFTTFPRGLGAPAATAAPFPWQVSRELDGSTSSLDIGTA